MTNVLPFVPKRDRDASSNLREFIRMCREELTVFGADLDWSSNYWTKSKVTFGNLDVKKRRSLENESFMQQPFLDFAKAYHRYRQGMRPARNNIDMRALKCLERALAETYPSPSVEHAKGFVFDRAAVLCSESYGSGAAYRAGCELEAIAKFLVEKHLVSGLFPWRNTIPRPVDTVRTGIEARKLRDKKLPADELLNALAVIFANNPISDRDVFTSSLVALLMCAPSRCGEVLLLPAGCEVAEEKRDGDVAYGWRFFTSKGGLPMIKWVPDVMVPIAKEAMKRVRRMTDAARRLAAWLEDHPNEFFRHAGCPNVGEDDSLDEWQIAGCLGCLGGDATRSNRANLRAELRRIGIDTRSRAFTLRDLNGWVHARLPNTFRLTAVRYGSTTFAPTAISR